MAKKEPVRARPRCRVEVAHVQVRKQGPGGPPTHRRSTALLWVKRTIVTGVSPGAA